MISKSTTVDGLTAAERVLAALAYIWFLFLIPLILKRNSKFCQFHAKQGLVLFIIELVGGLVFWVPLFGQLLVLVLFVFSLVGIFEALAGNYWPAPIIGDYAKKIKL